MSSWPGSAVTLLSCSYFQCLQIGVFFINGKEWTRRNLSAQNRRRGRKEQRKKGDGGKERGKENRRKVAGERRKKGKEGKGRKKKLGWKEKNEALNEGGGE